jgi:hypothetical protein
MPAVVGGLGGVGEPGEGGVEVEPAQGDETARVLDRDPVRHFRSFAQLVGGSGGGLRIGARQFDELVGSG